MGRLELELYIHIPFCVKKCAYCDFLSFSSTQEERKDYVDALLGEIDQYRDMASRYFVTSIFIGGGTPSVLEAWQMACIMSRIREVFTLSESAEITVEVNPGTIDEVKIQIYKACGINRISIGLQATNDEELRMLGRIHCYEEFLETYHMIRAYGIENINIDLISAIPKQTAVSWTETLERIISLEPTHISAYSLIIEEGTLFYEHLDAYESLLPSEEDEREMYHLTKEKLAKAGYIRYETSNYAKAGYECRHNLGYWNRVDYLGLGLGAASLLENVRYTNEKDLTVYIEGDVDKKVEKVELTRDEQMEEFMFLGLRKIEGVSKKEFYQIFQHSMEVIYGEVIQSLIEKELIECGDDYVRLTELGIDVSNYVMAEFLFE